MKMMFKQALAAFSLGAITLTGVATAPAQAQGNREYRRDVNDARRDYNRNVREARRDYNRDIREARQERREDVRNDRRDWRNDRNDWRNDRRGYYRPGRTVYAYDYNRPDPRYGRYYQPNRYYRGGYEPIRVNRSTRIYRGYDDRYYCRRSDGTTGLIVGAALGGLLGSQIDRGHSNVAGILIGGGAGALLGREIDRGNVNCR
ncbi:glycine zipper 2TM domain-containing protein [Sphingobium sp. CAP-1]|uniref:glycine zipper 2TM domain-containing protein n=1 Tax=Sphingobium sp. CAP-1 TaxID=2676077 RepID=UPI0018AD16CB|nr:glycine zipper 2TM domain-containing protein [Sphingobium sp. CAP-1]